MPQSWCDGQEGKRCAPFPNSLTPKASYKDSWLIVALLGSHDETSTQAHTGQRGEGLRGEDSIAGLCRKEGITFGGRGTGYS